MGGGKNKKKEDLKGGGSQVKRTGTIEPESQG